MAGRKRGPCGGDHPHHGMPPWFFHFMGPPPKPGRGEVRYLILDAIAEQPRHGYDVIRTIEQKSGGAYRPSPGTIYPNLQMLEEMGHAVASEEQGRKVYSITDDGKQELEDHADEVAETYDRFREGCDYAGRFDFGDLGKRIGRMMRSIRSGLRHGRIGGVEWKEIQRVIENAAKEVEDLFREDEESEED
jgi:DNA-binding PadR family transcriptional regulator